MGPFENDVTFLTRGTVHFAGFNLIMDRIIQNQIFFDDDRSHKFDHKDRTQPYFIYRQVEPNHLSSISVETDKISGVKGQLDDDREQRANTVKGHAYRSSRSS